MAKLNLMLVIMLGASALLMASPIQQLHHQKILKGLFQQRNHVHGKTEQYTNNESKEGSNINVMSQDQNLKNIDKLNAKFKKMMKTTKMKEKDAGLLLKNAKLPNANIKNKNSLAAEEIANIHHKEAINKAADRILKKIEQMELDKLVLLEMSQKQKHLLLEYS